MKGKNIEICYHIGRDMNKTDAGKILGYMSKRGLDPLESKVEDIGIRYNGHNGSSSPVYAGKVLSVRLAESGRRFPPEEILKALSDIFLFERSSKVFHKVFQEVAPSKYKALYTVSDGS